MTRHRWAAVVIALACLAGSRAEAQGWRGWLDRLSGPGEFDGYGVFFEFLCYGVDRFSPGDPGAAGQPPRDTPGRGRRELFVDVDCSKADLREGAPRPIVIGVETAWYSTNRNPLTYAGDPPAELREVTLRTLVPFADFVATSWLELGAGVGVAWFDGELFGTTSKLMVEPLRVTVKPLTLAFPGGHRALEILQVRGQVVTFPGGFDAADFGAVPGSWKAGTELLWGAALVIDLGVLR
jgi:hypothetical protein